MNFLPIYHYKYNQLYLQQTAGLSLQDLELAQAIGAGPVVNLLATRYQVRSENLSPEFEMAMHCNILCLSLLDCRLNDGSQDVLSPPPTWAPPGVFREVAVGDEGNFLGRYQTTQPLCITAEQLVVRNLLPLEKHGESGSRMPLQHWNGARRGSAT